MSVTLRKNFKLNPRFNGPYKITQKVGVVAYRLQLLEGVLIHLVFHISLLKKTLGRMQFFLQNCQSWMNLVGLR